MAKTKEQKQKIIEELKEKIGKQKAMFIVDYKGLKTKELFALRKRLKKIGGLLYVAKKTLMELAFKDKGIKMERAKPEGQTAIIFGLEDEIEPAKTAYQFSREFENLKILGGFAKKEKGWEFLEAEKVIELAKLPTKTQLLAQLIRTINAPVSGLANVLQGNIRGFIFILSRIKS